MFYKTLFLIVIILPGGNGKGDKKVIFLFLSVVDSLHLHVE